MDMNAVLRAALEQPEKRWREADASHHLQR